MTDAELTSMLATIPRRIETPRMVITPRNESDYPQIVDAQLESWPEIHHWVAWADDWKRFKTPTFADSMRKLDHGFKTGANYFGVARMKGTGEIGPQVTLYRMNHDEHVGECGYWAPTKLTGQGLTTEAMAALLRVGFNQYGLQKIVANHSDGNEASRRVLKKLGFEWTHSVENGAKRGSGEALTAHHYVLDDIRHLPEGPG